MLIAVRPREWRRAYQFSLLNATLFLLLSWTQFLLQPTSLPVILFVPALFFAGAMIAFLLLVRSGGALAAVAWFVLGAGVYFGLGTLLGGLAPDPRSMQYGSEAVLVGDILRVDILNSSSIVLVLAAAMPFVFAPGTGVRREPDPLPIEELLERLFPAVVALALIALGLQLVYFPVAANLVVRTFLSYAYMVVPFCLLTLGMIWPSLGYRRAALGVLVLVSAMALSLLAMSKSAIIANVIPLLAGTWVWQRGIKSIAGGLLVAAAIYGYAGAIANDGRLHADYDAATNSPLTRAAILVDTVSGEARGDRTAASGPRPDVVVPSTFIRLSTSDIQAYLMDQYDNRQPGSSLDDFWVALIPRLLWPGKPIVTRFGSELHEQFWAIANADSALAPTYTAEAYWNYGPLGVVMVSLLIGAEIGWLTRRWQFAAGGSDLAFLLIAFPAALWASFVESWIAATYVGGFLTIVMLWCAARIVLRRWSAPRGHGRGAAGRRAMAAAAIG